MSPSDHEDDNDPDGPFAFKRRRYCAYYAVSIFTAVILTVYGSQNHICTLFFFPHFSFSCSSSCMHCAEFYLPSNNIRCNVNLFMDSRLLQESNPLIFQKYACDIQCY